MKKNPSLKTNKYVQVMLLMIIIPFFFGTQVSYALVTVTNPGNTTPALAATYTTLANAITALNATTTISGPVGITLAGNETAPIGGYAVTAIPAGASDVNSITIQGSSSTITAFHFQATGSLNDAIFKLIGADYITIQNFTMQEYTGNVNNNPATNDMTEFGIALFYESLTNGAQHNTIENNIISLNRSYRNTMAIYSNTRHTSTDVITLAEVTAAAGANSANKVYGNTISNVNYGIVFIGAGTTMAAIDDGNDIGGSSLTTGNTISNWGGLTRLTTYVSVASASYCIYMNQQINDNVSFNTITSATLAQSTLTYGIYKDYAVAAPSTGTLATSINNNTIQITNNPTLSTGNVYGIYNSGATTLLATATLNINNNNIQNCSIGGGAATSPVLYCIWNTSDVGTLNFNGNTLLNNAITATTATTGSIRVIYNQGDALILNINSNILQGSYSSSSASSFIGINNSSSVQTAININNNQLGNASGDFYSTLGATSGQFFGIYNPSSPSTCSVSIQSNDFRGITFPALSSSTVSLIQTQGTPLALNVSSNTFTNLDLNTTGTLWLILGSAIGTEVFDNNAIVTGLNKSAGGSINCMTIGGNCVTSTVTNNNLSNITASGATQIFGLNDDSGSSSSAPEKILANNTFSNWTAGTSVVYVVSITRIGGTTSNISNNTITNINAQSSIVGILVLNGFNGATTLHINNNTFNNLSSSGSSVTAIQCGNSSTNININNNTISALSTTAGSGVIGITVSGNTNNNIFRNKICDLFGSHASSTVTGITVSTGTNTIYNNIIGDLRTPSANATNPLNGIRVTGGSASNLYYNTVHIEATSTGAIFGSTALFASTTPVLLLRNNIFHNASTTTGAGNAAAYRRSSITLTSYNALSNNNLFFGSTIFTDGTNSDVTLTAYKARVNPRDVASVTENLNAAPTFLSTTCGTANFLHINTTVNTLIESGGAAIAGITDDFDGNTRNITTPDIGADEFTGCNITADITPSTATLCSGQNLTLTENGTGASTWLWSTGATTQSISVNTAGTFTVTVTNAIGCTASTSVTTTINANPTPTISGSISFCSGSATTLDAGSYSSYNWSTSETTQTISVNTAGTFTVTVTNANGCTGSTSVTTTVNSNPTPTISGSTSFCSGSSTTLDAGSYTSYNWSTGETTQTISVNTAGTFTVTVTDANGCTGSASVATTVIASPISSFTVSCNPMFPGNAATLTSTSTAGSGTIVSYQWNLNGSSIGGATNATYTAGVNANGNYSLTVTNSNACSNTSANSTLNNLSGPLSGGSYSIPSTCGFQSINSAVAYMNVNGISDSVVFNVAAGYAETAPVGGIVWSQCGLAANLISSVSQSVTFQKSGPGVNPMVYGYVGINSSDAIIKIAGGDYLTFDAIDLRDTNTVVFPPTHYMEWGYALLKCDGNNGSNHVTIRNCNIRMNNTNMYGSIGIYSNNHSSASATQLAYTGVANDAVAIDAARNGHNSFYGNNIIYVHTAISLTGNASNSGSYSLKDTLNQIGIPGTGNSISGMYNYSSSQTTTVEASNQQNISVTNNYIFPGQSIFGSNYTGILNAMNISSSDGIISNNSINYYGGFHTGIFKGIVSNGIPTVTGNRINLDAINPYDDALKTGYSCIMGSSTASPLLFNSNKMSPCYFTGGQSLNGMEVSFPAGSVGTCSNNSMDTVTFFVAKPAGINGTMISVTGGTGSSVSVTHNTVSQFNILPHGDVKMLAVQGYNVNVDSNTITRIDMRNLTVGNSFLTCISINALASYNCRGNVVAHDSIRPNSGNSSNIASLVGIKITGSCSTENISNNTLSDLQAVTGGYNGNVTGISVSTNSGSTRLVEGNVITGLYSAHEGGIIIGLSSGSGGTVTVSKNRIDSLNAVYPKSITGILNSGGTATTYSNNFIGQLSSYTFYPTGSTITGFHYSGGTAVNFYNNTIYITPNNTGNQLTSSGIYAAVSSALDMRNNIIVNLAAHGSVSGNAVAYRRATSSFPGYATSSDNNLFYAGTPSANHLIYYDGTNTTQTLAAYKYLAATRDQHSKTENVSFLNVNSTSSNFLHINPTVPSYCESGGANIAGITNDYDGDTRQGNAGYTGTGTAPDMGADEFEGLPGDITPPAISYTAISDSSCAYNVTLAATITDASGVNATAGMTPRLYFRKSTDVNTYTGNTNANNGWKYVEATNTTSPFTFTTNFSLLQSAVVPGDNIQYFIVAEDLASTPNIGLNSGTFANEPFGVALFAIAFPISGSINSTTIVADPTPTISGATVFCASSSTTLDAGSYSSYSWSTGATTQTISVNTAGTITVTVTNAYGCTGSISVTTTVNANPTPTITGSLSFCAGSSTTLDAGSYISYNWSTGSTTQTISANTDGTFTVTAMDGNGCTGSTSVTTTVNANPTPTITGNLSFCAGSSTTLDAGVFSSFSWSTGVTTQTISVSTAGTFTVTVTDGNGCTGSASATTTISNNLTPTITGNLSFCAGSSTILDAGVFTSYNWSTGATTQTISVNTAGTFTVTVTSGSGCTGSASATTTVNANPTPTITGSLSFCAGSSTTLDAGSYISYNWSTGSTTQTISANTDGTFTVTAMDGNGCTGSTSVTTTVNANPTPTITGNLSFCAGSSTTLDAGVFSSYSWSTGATTQTISVNTAGTFTVTVTNANECTGSASVNTTVNANPIPTFTGSLSFCAGSSTILNAGVFSSYNWSTGATTQTISVNTAGTFTVTVTDGKGCTGSASATTTISNNLTPTITGNLSFCAGSSTILDAGVFTSYNWSTGATTQTISVNTAGTFTVTVTSGSGCTGSASATTTVNANPTPTITGSLSFCAGSSTVLNAGVFSSYNWSTGATTQTISVNTAGTFTATVTNANGCTGSTSVSTIVNANPTPTITGSLSFCAGSSTTLDAGSYTSYTWSTGATTQTISVNTAGTFTATVTNANGCTGSTSVSTIVNANPTPTITGSLSFCAGSSTTLDAGSYTSYNWSTGATTQTISVNTAGTFTVTVTNANGCTGSTSVITTVNANPTPTITGSLSFCAGSSTTLDAGSYTSYTWSTGATTQTISVNTAGTFTATVTNANGCTGSTSVSTIVNANPTPTITGSLSFCAGSSTTLDAGVFSSYSWSTGATTQTLSVNTAGTFTVTVTNGNGCTSSTSVTTIVNANLTPNISGASSFCAPGSVALNAGAGYSSYSWSTGATTQTINVALAGTYTVSVTNVSGCTGSTSKVIAGNATPAQPGSISGATTICKNSNEIYSIALIPGAASYTWTATSGATVSTGQGSTSVVINFSNAATSAIITVVAVNACGSSIAKTLAYTVTAALPSQPSTINGQQYGVCNLSNVAYNCPVTVNASSYLWTVPTSVTILTGQGSNSITVKYTSSFSGTGTITVAAVSGCGSSAATTRTVNSKPKQPVISGQNWACKGQTGLVYSVAPVAGATSYTWTIVNGSSLVSGQGTTSITVNWGGINGVIKCTASNACGSSIAGQLAVSFTCKEAADNELFSELSLYPNPASTIATLQFEGYEVGNAQLVVYDLVGKELLNRDVEVGTGSNEYKLDLANYPKGVYTVRVVYNSVTQTKKLIIQ